MTSRLNTKYTTWLFWSA